MTYFLLITHCTALLPISICLWSWKERKDSSSLFMLIQYIFIVCFSLFYHTYDIDDIITHQDHQTHWTFLDAYQSTSLINITVLYCLRVRPPIFYIISNLINMLVLIFILFELNILIIYFQTLITISALVIKWKTVYQYLLRYYYISSIVIICACLSLWFYTESHKNTSETNTYHSLWHCTIFTTAGCGAILRYKLDSMLYPIITVRDRVYVSPHVLDI